MGTILEHDIWEAGEIVQFFQEHPDAARVDISLCYSGILDGPIVFAHDDTYEYLAQFDLDIFAMIITSRKIGSI